MLLWYALSTAAPGAYVVGVATATVSLAARIGTSPDFSLADPERRARPPRDVRLVAVMD